MEDDTREWDERLIDWLLHTNIGVLTFVGVQLLAVILLVALI